MLSGVLSSLQRSFACELLLLKHELQTACFIHWTYNCCGCLFRAGLNRYVDELCCNTEWMWFSGHTNLSLLQKSCSHRKCCYWTYWTLWEFFFFQNLENTDAPLLAALCRWRQRSVLRVSTRLFRASRFPYRMQPKEPYSSSPKNASTTCSWWANFSSYFRVT